jgi:hypothetical protein
MYHNDGLSRSALGVIFLWVDLGLLRGMWRLVDRDKMSFIDGRADKITRLSLVSSVSL